MPPMPTRIIARDVHLGTPKNITSVKPGLILGISQSCAVKYQTAGELLSNPPETKFTQIAKEMQSL